MEHHGKEWLGFRSIARRTTTKRPQEKRMRRSMVSLKWVPTLEDRGRTRPVVRPLTEHGSDLLGHLEDGIRGNPVKVTRSGQSRVHVQVNELHRSPNHLGEGHVRGEVHESGVGIVHHDIDPLGKSVEELLQREAVSLTELTGIEAIDTVLPGEKVIRANHRATGKVLPNVGGLASPGNPDHECDDHVY